MTTHPFMLLWYDDTKQASAAKIRAALACYLIKFGRPATTVLCHVECLPLETITGVDVRAVPWAQRNHFLVSEEAPQQTAIQETAV